MWFNGYISPTVNAAQSCTSKCVSGLPTNYVPYETPLNNNPAGPNYGSNDVNVTLSPAGGGTTLGGVTFAPGPSSQGIHPLAHTFLNGPNNWNADASLFKVFPITERVNLRFNMDAFNVFNVQGYTNPSGTDGTEQFVAGVGQAKSYWATQPRIVQFTLRLSF
jgi:hypothetical protein